VAVDAATIAVALGRPTFTETEQQQWAMWVTDARMLIQARLGELADLDQARLDYVVREAVVAHIRHPDDATQVSVSVDDATSSRTYRSGKGRVVILDEWWDLLSPDTSSSGAFVVDVLGAASMHLPWCSIYWGAELCSCGASIAGHPIYELAEDP
jgi:Fe-S cluster biosynthesis and repair protein YggX